MGGHYPSPCLRTGPVVLKLFLTDAFLLTKAASTRNCKASLKTPYGV